MASNKNRLGKLLGNNEPPAAREPIQKGTPFQVSTTPPLAETDLPAQFGELSTPLQEIARRYVGARRRSGEALLEAARWLSEARATAEHGEWQVFLDATGTSADAAERLLNIHRTAMQNQQFADAIARNWLGQSVAALLARPSTPPEVVDELLGQETAPRVEDVREAIGRTRGSDRTTEEVQIPQNAEFVDVPDVITRTHDSHWTNEEVQIPQNAGFADRSEGQGIDRRLPMGQDEKVAAPATSLDRLRQAVELLADVVEDAALRDEAEIQTLLITAEQALDHIRRRLAERHG